MLRGLVAIVAFHCERYFVVSSSLRGGTAKQSQRSQGNGDCFASLAMTIRGATAMTVRGATAMMVCCIAMIMLSGCAIFKTTKKDVALDERSAKWEWSGKSILKSSMEKNSNSLLLRRDSGTHTFSVRIWPKGAFTFSAEHGFVGTADSLTWYGDSKGINTSSSQQQSLEKNKINAEHSAKAKSAERTDRSKTTTETWISWKWIVAAVLGIILILSYLLRRIRI